MPVLVLRSLTLDLPAAQRVVDGLALLLTRADHGSREWREVDHLHGQAIAVRDAIAEDIARRERRSVADVLAESQR